MMPLPVPRVGFSNCGKPCANDSAGSAAVPSATAARWARREWRMRFCMVVPFRSGEEEEAQDEVHRDEADADAEELALVEAALGPPHVGRSDEIGRASCRKECVSTCRSRWSPYH